MSHDITREDDWRTILTAAGERFGQVDILVNNAGIAILEPIKRLSIADFDRLLEINFKGAFIGCKLFVEQLRPVGRSGSIVNVSSVAGIVGVRGRTGYGAFKASLRLLSKSIAIEAGLDGIRCNSVHPGAIWTEIQDAAIAQSPETYAAIADSIPLGRIGNPADVAAAVLFLASDDSHYFTELDLRGQPLAIKTRGA